MSAFFQVNATLAAKLLSEDGKEAPNKKAKTGQTQLLEDDRFKDMFQDPAFTIDETAEEYRILHPNAGKTNFLFSTNGTISDARLDRQHGPTDISMRHLQSKKPFNQARNI